MNLSLIDLKKPMKGVLNLRGKIAPNANEGTSASVNNGRDNFIVKQGSSLWINISERCVAFMLYVLLIHVTRTCYLWVTIANHLLSKMIGSYYLSILLDFTCIQLLWLNTNQPVVWAPGVLFSTSRTPLEWLQRVPQNFFQFSQCGHCQKYKVRSCSHHLGAKFWTCCSWYRYKILPSSEHKYQISYRSC